MKMSTSLLFISGRWTLLFLLLQGEELGESAQENRANAEMRRLLSQKFLRLPWKPEVKRAFIVWRIIHFYFPIRQ